MPLLTEDANCKSHVYISGGALVDSKTNITWNKVGAPAFVPSAAIGVPGGQSAEGVNGFSDTAYWSSSAASEALDFTGDFIVSVIFKCSATTSNKYVFSDESGSAGYALGLAGGLSPGAMYQSDTTTYRNASIVGTGSPGSQTHMVTLARSGTTLWLKVDGQPIQKWTGVATSAATGNAAYIGRHYTTSYAWDGTFYELYASSTTPTVTLINNLHASVGFAVGGQMDGLIVPTAQQKPGFFTSVRRRAVARDGWLARAVEPAAFQTQYTTRLLCQDQTIAQPSPVKTSGPAVNLWMARIVFRVLKPSWFYGLHPRGNKPRANFNPGLDT